MPPDVDAAERSEPEPSPAAVMWHVLRSAAAQPPGAERRDVFLRLFAVALIDLVTLPYVVLALFSSRRIDPAYGLTWATKLRLGWQVYRNCQRVHTATSYKAHLAMAAKLFEVPKSTPGVVVECGSYLGGSAANLSLACELAGRELIIYDSFEGMPPPVEGDRYSTPEATGGLRGTLERVRRTIEQGGAIDRCTFRKGWFEDTLPGHTEPIVLWFVDVDWQASLHDCLVNLWPHLVDGGFLFLDEYVYVDYCAVFFSERYWSTYFDTTPPGLLGVGTGIPLGQVFTGPWLSPAPLQTASSVAYTWKGNSGYWDFYPDR